MADRLLADFGTINAGAEQLDSASRIVSGSMLLTGKPWLGSASVENALARTTAVHSARLTAAARLLASEAAGVRQAVTDMIAADHAAAAAVSP